MSANFSSDSIVWVDGQVTLPKHILKILGIENGHRSNVTFIVENGEVKSLTALPMHEQSEKAKDKEAA